MTEPNTADPDDVRLMIMPDSKTRSTQLTNASRQLQRDMVWMLMKESVGKCGLVIDSLDHAFWCLGSKHGDGVTSCFRLSWCSDSSTSEESAGLRILARRSLNQIYLDSSKYVSDIIARHNADSSYSHLFRHD